MKPAAKQELSRSQQREIQRKQARLAVANHARGLGMPCSKATATILRKRYGGVQGAKRAIDRMAAGYIFLAPELKADYEAEMDAQERLGDRSDP